MTTLQQELTMPVFDEPGEARRSRMLRLLGAVVAALILAALLYALADLHSKNSSLENVSSMRTSATQAADRYGVWFGSYDYRNLSSPTASWTEVENHSTPAFKKDYQTTSGDLKSTIVSYKATATAKVSQSAVSAASGSRAVVLLLLQQTITNSTQKSGPQTQQFIVTMTLLHQKGQWLIDNVQASA